MIKKTYIVIAVLLGSFFLTNCTNQTSVPKGVFFKSFSVEPESLHPIRSSDVYASIIHSYTFDELMIRNPETYEFEPYLAERYTVSPDKKTYRFYLRKNATFHDGTPVTAHDVVFNYTAIHDPKFKALNLKPYYEGLSSVKAINDHTVEIVVKNKYFGNFATMVGLQAIPRHIYDNDKKNNKILIGSGPYKLESYTKNKSIVLVKNPSWWGNGLKGFEKIHRLPKIHIRFVKSPVTSFEMFKKGQLDYLSLRPEDYVMKAKGEGWGTKYISHKVENSSPKGYVYIGWNLKSDLFKDKKVRQALTHLMNRELMIEKFDYNLSLPATGPWYQQSPYAAKVKPFSFDLKRGVLLLKQAGWADSDKDGILDKKIKGQKVNFQFTLLMPSKTREKYMTLYKEDLKKAGIDMELQILEWSSFVKKLDEAKFDAVTLGWSAGSVDNDPKQIWHSTSIGAGGSNFISYSNPEVDKLIDKARMVLDRKKRIVLYQQIYKKIAEDAPYLFLFNSKYALYAVSKRVEMEKPTYKYSIGEPDYWTLTE